MTCILKRCGIGEPRCRCVCAQSSRLCEPWRQQAPRALDAFVQDVRGARCIDIGSSTGGFTDCLLQAGAAEVACVDVNYGQLAWKLREDERVRVFERTNIKTAVPAELGAPFDIVVADLSFIGLAGLAGRIRCIVRAWYGVLAREAQFESAHDETDRGIVRDESVRLRVVKEVSDAFAAVGFSIEGAVESPIKGAEGNVEYLVKRRLSGMVVCREPEARRAR